MPALITPDDAIDRYGTAQGNILKGHGRKNAVLLFVEFIDPARVRQWIGQLLTDQGPRTPHITFTAQQLLDRKKFQEAQQRGETFDAGLFTSLLFTAEGLRHLQVPAMPQEALNQAPNRGRNGAFESGMRNLAASGLHDPALTRWDAGWRTADGTGSSIHALLLLADNEVNNLQQVAESIRGQADDFGIRVRVQEQGQRLVEGPEGNEHDIEHFGYADGVSQPLYLTDDVNGPTPHSRDMELGAEDLVLVPDVLSAEAQSWGSFFVFRKLEQDVPGFKAAEEKLGEDLGLTGEDAERAGAMLVGRFENGTPVTLLGSDKKPAGPNGKPLFTNDFTFADDEDGLKCPFHAHIRKMNPRGETEDAAELRHRITRRGIPYGTREEAKNGQEAGLLFMCYQRNIGQQFEFMQQSWANNQDFLFGQGTVGLDPIIGQGRPVDLSFPTTWGVDSKKAAPFAQFVTLRGGEYFYAPSRGGLAALAQAGA